MNDWSVGQVWKNLIIIKGRIEFPDERVTQACNSEEALLHSARGWRDVRKGLYEKATRDRVNECIIQLDPLVDEHQS